MRGFCYQCNINSKLIRRIDQINYSSLHSQNNHSPKVIKQLQSKDQEIPHVNKIQQNLSADTREQWVYLHPQ
jgi:hypothetical protein